MRGIKVCAGDVLTCLYCTLYFIALFVSTTVCFRPVTLEMSVVEEVLQCFK